MTTSTTGDGASDVFTQPAAAWLDQGDLFRAAPIVDYRGNSGVPSVKFGPAMLLTHGCAMDKPERAQGTPKIPRLHFARLLSIPNLPASRAMDMRRRARRVDPSEVLYLGHLPELGEVYAELSDTWSVPAGVFDLALLPSGDEQSGERRLHLASGDSRVASLTDEHVELLKTKIMKYWTRRIPG